MLASACGIAPALNSTPDAGLVARLAGPPFAEYPGGEWSDAPHICRKPPPPVPGAFPALSPRAFFVAGFAPPPLLGGPARQARPWPMLAPSA
jgi:hypothetical protein